MSPPSKPNAALVLAAGFLILFVCGGARFAIGLTLKPMVEELGWLRGDLGLAVAIFQVVSAIFMFVAGRMADRVSIRLLILLGILISAVALAGMSLVAQPWHAVVLYGVVFAVGNGIGSVTVVGVMVTRVSPNRAGLANAFVSSGMSLGQLVIVAALAAVLVGIGWRSVFVWVGAAHLLLLPVLFAVPGASHAQAHAGRVHAGDSLAEAVRRRQFWLLAGLYAVCGFDDFFVSTHVVAFAQDLGVDAFLAGNLLAVMGIFGLIGVMWAGWWGDRSGPVPPTLASFIARVAVFGLILVDQSKVSVLIFALVFGLTFLVTAPLTVLYVRDTFGTRNLGAISGLITMIHHTCGGFGAWLGARVFDQTGSYNGAFAAVFVASIAAIVFSLLLKRPAPRIKTSLGTAT
jgi:predicted MFS family arabinose efflux permease